MLNKKEKVSGNFAEELNTAVVNTLRTALEGILKMDYPKQNAANGKTETDYELTARMMKAQARIALDLISNIQKDNE